VYEILGRVATTRTGAVWKARDTGLDRLVALKELDAAAAATEAAALARLSSPHVVEVFGVVEDGARAYLVEEWVDGATLATVLQAAGRLDVAQALGVMRGALLGLAAVHDAGLVHGDVSATNILLDGSGTARLIDFGSVTRTGSAAGAATGAFAAPEVRSGGPVSPSADVYAAAAVLAMLMHGRVEAAPSTRGVDEGLRGILDTALSDDPATRYPNAGAFLAALEESAERRYGTAWWTQAGIGTLATGSATALLPAGTNAPFAGQPTGGPGAAAEQGAADNFGAGVATVGRKRIPRRTLVVGGMAAAVITAGVFVAVAASGGDDAKDTARAGTPTITSRSSAPVVPGGASSSAAALPITGKYGVTVTVASVTGIRPQDPAAKVGTVFRRTWATQLTCSGAACTARVRSSSGSKFLFTITGTEWRFRTSAVGGCFDDRTGKRISSTTHHLTITLHASAPGAGALPAALQGQSLETAPPHGTCRALRLVEIYRLTRIS
jgi:eukaryotic-like serine/threonine-protein kinase